MLHAWLEAVDRWMEAPLVVLNGAEAMILIGLLLMVVGWPRRRK